MSAPSQEDRNAIWIGFVAVAAFMFALGLYAVALNELLYAVYGPFYDSMGYANSLARMTSDARANGTVAALSNAMGHSTVAYPWLVFAPFADKLSPTRSIGVWIQVASLGAMQLALLFYFLRRRRMPLLQAFIFSGAFVLIAAAFHFNGGITDFRMDLLQYILMAETMAVYLIARQSDGFGWWIALGFVAGVLCLARATTPVYLVPIFAVLAAGDVIGGVGRRRAVLLRWLVVAVMVAIVAGWFYISNFRLLYHYYVEWNPDANARLPLAISHLHLILAFRHIGFYVMIALIIACTLVLIPALGAAFKRRALPRLNWRPLVFSAVPLGYLVFSGAGLNPFVSIVGAAGIIMFLLDPIDGERPSWGPAPTAIALAALTAAGLWTAAAGIRNHGEKAVSFWVPRQLGLRQMVEAMTGAIRADGRSRAFTYAVVHIGSVAGPAVFNTMVYDRRLPLRGNGVGVGNARIVQAQTRFDVSTDFEWKKFGTDDGARIAIIVSRFEESVDFVIIPTADSKLPEHARITAFVPEITRRLLASGQWTALTEPIVISTIERVIVLRNNRRMPATPAQQP